MNPIRRLFPRWHQLNAHLSALHREAKFLERRCLDFVHTNFGQDFAHYAERYSAVKAQYDAQRRWYHPRLKEVSEMF